ncbi:hypothetical protein ACH4YO_16310 [Streptomyces noursei]|uniref:hypothetical protein n=1 Tax=Streptomyces noursei TaxID=1971 RepID=UPI0034107B81
MTDDQERGLEMHRRKLGVAMGLTLVLALTGCSGGKGGGDGVADAPFNPSQLAQAIPSQLAAPKGWKGQEPHVLDGSAARKQCETQAQWSCAGLTAQATTRHFSLGSVGDTNVMFTLLAYDSVENAKVGMKAAVTENHKDEKTKPKPLTIDTDADETDAYTDQEYSAAALRVGSVVAVMFGKQLPKDHDLPSFAKLQVKRITTAATGKNPDA